MPKKTIIYRLDARLPDILFRLPWAAPVILLSIALYRYFTFGKNFMEFMIWALIAFLIPAFSTLLLNRRNKSYSEETNIQIDSQGILYLTQSRKTKEIPLQSVTGMSVRGRSKDRHIFLKMNEGSDIFIPWPWELGPDDVSQLKDSLKVFGVRLKG